MIKNILLMTILSLIMMVHPGAVSATTWKPITALEKTPTPSEMLNKLPEGATLDWLLKMSRRGKESSHRQPLNLSEAYEDMSNFGGYVNLLTQDVALDFNPETGFIDETISVTLEVNEDDTDKIPLSFPDHFEISEIKNSGGEDQEWSKSANTLIVYMDPPSKKGELLEFTMKASGTVICSNDGIKPCSFGGNYAYVTHADYYLQGSPIVLDMFQGSLEVTVPPGKQVVATGRLEEAVYNEESNSFRFVHDYETIYYSFAVADYQVTEELFKGVPIRVHTREKDVQHHTEVLDVTRNILEFYTTEFSDFPFDDLDLVQMDKNFGGGYGPQSTVFMYSGTFDMDQEGWGGWGGSASRVQLISHEIAHQWWGNLVNMLEVNSVILSEGLAEFSSAFHWEKEYESRSNFISNGMNYVYTVPAEDDVPIGSAMVTQSYMYNTLAYDKASVVFDMLQHELGDETFRKGMSEYVATFGYSAANLTSFFETMSAVSGVDLDSFRAQWVDGTGYPRILARSTQVKTDEGDWLLQVSLEQVGEQVFTVQLPIQVTHLEDERKEIIDTIVMDSETVNATFRFDAPILRVSVDPDRIYLHRIQSQDQGDPNLSGIADGSDLIDMAIMMHRNIVFGYGDSNYFYPNASYNSRFDLNQDGSINEDDVALLIEGNEIKRERED